MLEEFVALDLEATGLNEKRDRIIEVGAVRFRGGLESEAYHTLINPQRELEERIIQLTGIRNEELLSAPVFAEIASGLREFLGDTPLVGHRIRGDVAMLKRAFAMEKLVFDAYAVDTLIWSRKCLPELESRQLGALCTHYEIPIKPHRAVEDARANGLLYLKLCEEFAEIREAQAAHVIVNVKRDTPATPAQREQIVRLTERLRAAGHLTADGKLPREGGEEWTIPGPKECKGLTRSEASRAVEYLMQAIRSNG